MKTEVYNIQTKKQVTWRRKKTKNNTKPSTGRNQLNWCEVENKIKLVCLPSPTAG